MHCLIHYLNCYYIYLISAMCSIFCWIYYRVVVKINLYQCQCHSYFSQQQKPSYTTYPPPSFVSYYVVRKEICLIDNYCTLTLPYDNG